MAFLLEIYQDFINDDIKANDKGKGPPKKHHCKVDFAGEIYYQEDMDLLKELEAKKERLRVLRERRKQTQLDYGIEPTSNDAVGGGNNGINETIPATMVDAAVQTSESLPSLNESTSDISSTVLPLIKSMKENCNIMTYDHGIQTEPIPQDVNEEVSSKKSGTESDKSNPPSDVTSLTKSDIPLFELKPLVLNSDSIGINHSNSVETFASRWYAKGENVKEQEKGNRGDVDVGSNQVIHLHTCSIEHLKRYHSILCQSIDYDKNRHVTCTSIVIKEANSKISIPKSFIYVIDTFTDKILDQIEFLGQIITKVKILRQFETHDIISMALLTQRGKIILYELQRQVQDEDGNTKLERNIVAKNYHLGANFFRCLWESKFKLFTADSNGNISILNSLDLSPDGMSLIINTENEGQDSMMTKRIQVIPPISNQLFTTEEKSFQLQTFIDEYLSRLVIFNEVNITSLVGSPFNEECLFLGTEDGGIYKIMLNSMNTATGKIMLNLNNNDFLPIEDDITNKEASSKPQLGKTLFHNGCVTGLSMDPRGLLLSSSIDWTIKLWDIKENQKLDEIDLGKPVLSVQWIGVSKDQAQNGALHSKYVCYAMTWDTIYIIQWFLEEEIDIMEEKRGRKHFKRYNSAKVLSKINKDQVIGLSAFTQFTTCKLIIEEESETAFNALLVISGDKSAIDYLQIIIKPR